MKNGKIQNFFSGKKILLTGHTGFKGAWLTYWLTTLGAQVKGIALPPTNEQKILFNSLKLQDRIESIFQDISDLSLLKKIVHQYSPEIVFHLAAQPIVKIGYWSPVETYHDNVIGTLNVLEAIRENGLVRSAVFITTDKCYRDKGDILYDEDAELGGYDPYSSSKACCELLIDSYRKSYFSSASTAVCVARAGNILGGGDFGKYRLVPDIIRTIELQQDLVLRSPQATRPWQYFLDVLWGYLLLAMKAYEEPVIYSRAYNFSNLTVGKVTVFELAQSILNHLHSVNTKIIVEQENFHETTYLQINPLKAKRDLGWEPKYNFTDMLYTISKWYKAYLNKSDLTNLNKEMLLEYMDR